MTICAGWELASWIATTLGAVFASFGIVALIYQLRWQRADARLAFLNQLYSQLDTHEARLAREHIFRAPAEQLRLAVLHSAPFEGERRLVEDTLAALDRLAYPIAGGKIPSDDAYELYGGVLLSVAHRLWPYVEDQREMRRKSGLRRRNSYRRFLEAVVRAWAPKYAEDSGLPPPNAGATTSEVLAHLFPGAPAKA